MFLLKLKKFIGVIAVVTGLFVMAPAHALDQGDWYMRFGAIHAEPNDSSGGLSGAPTVGVSVDGDTQLFATFNYMLREHIGLELLVATPFTHDVNATGALSGKIGEVSHLPPTFSVLYHFSPKSSVRPFVGAGINYTVFFDEQPTAVISSLELDDSWGYALEAGVDVDISKSWFFTANIRYINIETTAKTDLGNVDIDINPTLLSIGVGFSF